LNIDLRFEKRLEDIVLLFILSMVLRAKIFVFHILYFLSYLKGHRKFFFRSAFQVIHDERKIRQAARETFTMTKGMIQKANDDYIRYAKINIVIKRAASILQGFSPVSCR